LALCSFFFGWSEKIENCIGFWGEFALVSLSLLWWLFTFLAYKSARNGKIQPHKNWMQKSYLLCLSAMNLRIFLFIANHFLDLHGTEVYVIVSWLSWFPFLISHEIAIRFKMMS
jgi:hypothetical protein